MPIRATGVLNAAAWVAAAWLAVAPAWAADLQVSPVTLHFAPADQAQGLWLSNSGTRPLRAQVRVQAWSQADSADRLEPARDLVASPPVTEIAPGQQQLVRIVRPQVVSAPLERSYRLIVDELPAAPAADAKPLPGNLQFLLRYSIPVFIAPDGAVRPPDGALTDLSGLSARWDTGAEPFLSVANTGRSRVRIAQLVHEDAQGRRTILSEGLTGYVLAGQTMRWTLPAAARNLPPGQLKARINGDMQEQALPHAAGAL